MFSNSDLPIAELQIHDAAAASLTSNGTAEEFKTENISNVYKQERLGETNRKKNRNLEKNENEKFLDSEEPQNALE